MSDGETVYITGMDAATRSGEWLKRAETTYKTRLDYGQDPDAALEVAFGQAWAMLADALMP